MRVPARTFLCVQKHYKLLRPIQAAFSRRTILVKRKNVTSEAFLLAELNIHHRLKIETVDTRQKFFGVACELSGPFCVLGNIISRDIHELSNFRAKRTRAGIAKKIWSQKFLLQFFHNKNSHGEIPCKTSVLRVDRIFLDYKIDCRKNLPAATFFVRRLSDFQYSVGVSGRGCL